FSVTDSGIGIPKEKHSVIFEAFQQGDGTTSRKYGGTGLGLSISRQITRLLGGEIKIESTPGLGSTFTLFLPTVYPSPSGSPAEESETALLRNAAFAIPLTKPASTTVSRHSLATVVELSISDDRGDIQPGDRVLLIAEDDPDFAQIMLDLARDN